MEHESAVNILKKPSRNYGIDALRIVSMLLIVILHILNVGGVLESSTSVSHSAAWFLDVACFCAVNCYALISGYVGIFSKYKISNFALLWCRVALYSASITIIYKCFMPDRVRLKDIIFSFFPVISNQYWYFTAYAILFLFIPVLNAGMEKLSKRQLSFLLAGALLLVSVIQPFTNRAFNDVFVLSEGYSAWWLIILYLVGGYIRKYGLFRNIKAHRTGIFLSLYLIITLLTCFLTLMLKRFADRFCIDSNVFVKYQSITMVAAAVFLFLAFENVKFNRFFARIVGFLSPLAFSVYLIHVQPFVYDITITGHFIKIGHLPLPLMVLSIVGIAIAIYLVCSAIDLIRHCLFKAVKLKEGFLNLEDRIKLKLNRRKSN